MTDVPTLPGVEVVYSGELVICSLFLLGLSNIGSVIHTGIKFDSQIFSSAAQETY